MSAFVIDAFEFARNKERREGEIATADLGRLADESADRSGTLRWTLVGGADHLGHSQLTLSVAGSMQLMCQRCLTSFAFEISSESVLVLAKNEESADEIDALLDNDEIDVIVGSKALNIAELVEDEALLALPLSPKHPVCPDQSALDALKNVKEVSPFAMLKNLK
ncbi:YceD family protein [Paraherbaspirillum soli]|uniref:Large ribosomal RNA subunit accumulation protein YceD n=1 Tax=Paraherbaspirillum soli TaxID=631222 RepID=A0ABW0MBE6_9BURK